MSPLLVGGLSLLALTLAGHLGRGETNDTVWLFNHRLWLGALLAGVGAGLLAAGLVAIHETIKLLFGLTIVADRTGIYLDGEPRLRRAGELSRVRAAQLHRSDHRAREPDFTMRAAAALVKFVLVPLLLVYTAILYAYAAKIALAWELPKGTLGAMVVGYLFVGAATLLLGYPTRETGGPLVRLFWRYWVWLAALPVVLLFIAVWRSDRRLRPDRAALSDGADRRLGAGPRGLPHRRKARASICGSCRAYWRCCCWRPRSDLAAPSDSRC